MVQQAPGMNHSMNHSPVNMNHSPENRMDSNTSGYGRGWSGGLTVPGMTQIKQEPRMEYDDMDSNSPRPLRGSHSPGMSCSPHLSSPGETFIDITDDGMDSTTMYSNNVKRRKGGGSGGGTSTNKGIDEELCLICGDRASGYHYNALSCEGCKGFFRRSITRGCTYTCKYGGQCEMDMWMRRRCQACRLRRCREVGMKEECLLSEDQCKARDARRKARQRIQKISSQGTDTPRTPPTESDVQPSPDSNTSDSQQGSVEPSVNPLECVTMEHRELIENLVYNQDKYELPSEDDIQKVSHVRISDVGRPKEMSESIYKMVAEMTILTTQLVVEFAKHLPGFSDLHRDDQIILLKGSASEVMVLRTARRYDLESGTVILGNGMPMSKESMQLAGLRDYVENLFIFCRRMAVLGVDNAEYALITAMCILTERPGLNRPREIEQLHDMYLHALINYDKHRRSRGSNFLAKLLMKFTELQTVSQVHASSLYNLKLDKVSLPPLLSEYFDIMD